MSVTIKLEGVEVAVVRPGSGPTVINLSLPGGDKSALRMGQVMAGLVCLIFCWTSPYYFIGVWTGIPFILTTSLFVAHDRTSQPYLLVAASLMNFVSFVLAIAGVCLFNFGRTYISLEYFVLLANLSGLYICLQSFSWPAVFPLKKVEQDAPSLLDPLPPVYEEKSPYLDKASTMSVTIKLEGVEVAVVRPGSGPTVINFSLPGGDKSALRMGQVIAGVVCLILCWTSPFLLTGVWTGIPFILTASLFVAHDRTSQPYLLVAALLMNFVSLVLAIAGVCLFNFGQIYNNLAYFALLANLSGLYICLQSFSWPAGFPFPLKKVEQDAPSLLDPLPPVYEEKSPYLDKV